MVRDKRVDGMFVPAELSKLIAGEAGLDFMPRGGIVLCPLPEGKCPYKGARENPQGSFYNKASEKRWRVCCSGGKVEKAGLMIASPEFLSILLANNCGQMH